MTISFSRHQFPPSIIRHAVWLYVRFTLSYRDVEGLLAERGLDVSYETVRRWVLKFGPLFAGELRRRRPRPTARWHLDEVVVRIRDGNSGSGARSTMKAKFSISWCNDGATWRRPSS
jgi:transposase-like protein